jgi:pteridine reductase
LAGQGYAIGLHYHNSKALAETTLEEIRNLGVQAFPLTANLADSNDIAALFVQVSGLPHPLRVLVNSAAVMLKSELIDLTLEDWDDTLAINLRAPLLCAQHAARLMGPEGGLIINITDSGVNKNWTAYPAYLISKVGLESLTRLLARSLAPAIRVNAIAPGLAYKAGSMQDEEWQRLINRLPLKRQAKPEEISQALLFLLSNQYITGQTIVIDGGYQLI